MIQLIADSFGIHMHVMKEPFTKFENIDFQFRESYYEKFNYEDMKKQFVRAMKPNTILYVKDEFQIYYYAFMTPEEEYVFLGPFRYISTTEVEDPQVEAFYKLIPVVKEAAPLQFLLSGVFSKIYPEKGFHFIACELEEPASMFQKKASSVQDDAQLNQKEISNKYMKTTMLLSNVRQGNISKSLNQVRDLLKECVDIESMRRLAFEINVLLRHIAVEYKVNETYCENAYIEYDKRLRTSRVYMNIEETCFGMVSGYGALIQESARRANSNLIRDCLDYIEMHVSENVTLSSEARRLNVSTTYLSVKFKEETGENFVDYVNRVKIQYACMLLEKLKQPVQRISEICGFSSSNYFARVFKQQMGISPTEFRKNMQKNK